MISLPLQLFIVIMFFAGPIYGLVALIAMLRRAPRSRLRGVISVLCVVIGFLTLWAIERKPPTVDALCGLCLLAFPGMLAIIFVRPPKLQPGHCKACGYDLTGNVSGRCSECGMPIAPLDEGPVGA